MMLRSLALASLALASAAPQERAAEKIALRVLYAGRPDSGREKEFVDLLGRHFEKVGSIHLKAASTTAAKDWDVVVLDWVSIYARDEKGAIVKGKGLSMPPVKLDPGFSRATVMIGATGGSVGGAQKLKLDWL